SRYPVGTGNAGSVRGRPWAGPRRAAPSFMVASPRTSARATARPLPRPTRAGPVPTSATRAGVEPTAPVNRPLSSTPVTFGNLCALTPAGTASGVARPSEGVREHGAATLWGTGWPWESESKVRFLARGSDQSGKEGGRGNPGALPGRSPELLSKPERA